MGLVDFRRNLDVLALQVKGLTGLSFRKDKHPLTDWLVHAERNYLAGKRRLGCAQAAYAKFAIEDLQRVKSFDTELYASFKRELRRVQAPEDYFGWRMELRMASALISKGVSFQKSETPDFLLPGPVPIGIECSSCHLEFGKSHTPKELDYKFASLLRRKSGNQYTVSQVLLAIDMSSLLFHEGKVEFPIVLADKDKGGPRIQKHLDASPFQGLLAFCYSWTPAPTGKGATLTNYYLRIDRGKAAKEYMAFVERHYPAGDVWVMGHLHERV